MVRRLIACLSLCGCAHGAYGGTTEAQFADFLHWQRYPIEAAPDVSIALPGPGAATDCAGDGNYRHVCSKVEDGHGSSWTRVDVAQACGGRWPDTLAWTVVDGHDALRTTGRDLTSGRPRTVTHRRGPVTYESEPIMREETMCMALGDRMLMVTYRARDDSWERDATMREALFGSIRIGR